MGDWIRLSNENFLYSLMPDTIMYSIVPMTFITEREIRRTSKFYTRRIKYDELQRWRYEYEYDAILDAKIDHVKAYDNSIRNELWRYYLDNTDLWFYKLSLRSAGNWFVSEYCKDIDLMNRWITANPHTFGKFERSAEFTNKYERFNCKGVMAFFSQNFLFCGFGHGYITRFIPVIYWL